MSSAGKGKRKKNAHVFTQQPSVEANDSPAPGAQGVVVDTAGQGSPSTVSRAVRLWAPVRLPPGSQPPAPVPRPLQEPVSTLLPLALRSVGESACVNCESDPGTPLLRTFRKHSSDTPRCSQIKALVPAGRSSCLGYSSSLTSSPNRYVASHCSGCICSEMSPDLPVQCHFPAQLPCHCPACFLEVPSFM